MDYIEKAKEQLKAFGVAVSEMDGALLEICYNIVRAGILNTCNAREIPDGASQAAINRICGEFLYLKKSCGALNMDGIDLNSLVVKSITVGDTSAAYAVGDGQKTPEQRIDGLINVLKSSGKDDVLRYRKLVW